MFIAVSHENLQANAMMKLTSVFACATAGLTARMLCTTVASFIDCAEDDQIKYMEI